jgi:hypothetical protein
VKFDSTILPQTNTPTEIQKMGNDLLDKINQLGATPSTGPFVPLLPNPLIAGEPSLGTPHPHSVQFITAGAQNVGTQDYDLAANYPIDIKMLWVWGYWTTGAGGGGYIYVENSAGLPGGIGFTPSAAVPGQVFGLVVLNADRKVRLLVGNNNASAMNFYAQPYWM